MKLRHLAFLVCASLGGACMAAEPSPEPASAEASARPNSAASAWAVVSEPSDATLLEAPARVVVHPDAAAQIATTYRLQIEHVDVRPGDAVKAGDVLVRGLAPTLLDAAAALRATRGRVDVLRSRRDRLQELRREGLVEQSRIFELDAALAELDGERIRAEATLAAAGVGAGATARLTKGGHVSLLSPIDGTVREVDAVVGQVREPGAIAMVSIVGNGAPRIEARLSGPVPPATRFSFVMAGDEAIDLGPTPPTTVVVPEDGTTLAWWDAPTADARLAPGRLGRVRGRATDPDLREIPTSALRGEADRTTVLRETGDGATEVVEVEVVAASGTRAIVRGPLSLGDRVAADASRVLARPEQEAAP
jgi:multidrug efflux pump subunit AcrA (membrane-fusion protein)